MTSSSTAGVASHAGQLNYAIAYKTPFCRRGEHGVSFCGSIFINMTGME